CSSDLLTRRRGSVLRRDLGCLLATSLDGEGDRDRVADRGVVGLLQRHPHRLLTVGRVVDAYRVGLHDQRLVRRIPEPDVEVMQTLADRPELDAGVHPHLKRDRHRGSVGRFDDLDGGGGAARLLPGRAVAATVRVRARRDHGRDQPEDGHGDRPTPAPAYCLLHICNYVPALLAVRCPPASGRRVGWRGGTTGAARCAGRPRCAAPGGAVPRRGIRAAATVGGCGTARPPGSRPGGSARPGAAGICGGWSPRGSTSWSSAAGSPEPARRWTRRPGGCRWRWWRPGTSRPAPRPA